MKQFSLLSFLLIVVADLATFAQEQHLTISAQVIDAKTGAPLSYASVRVHHKNTGTLSNESGIFVFKIPQTNAQDSLEISFVGYKSEIIPISKFGDTPRQIPLDQAIGVLDEVTIRSKDGLEIIKEVMARIPVNYDTTGKQLQAFYREEINLEKDSIAFNEAVLDIYKSSYINDNDKDQINLLKGRSAKIHRKPDPLYGWLSGLSNGARGSVGEDILKNPTAKYNPLNPKNFRYYNYKLTDVVDEGTKSLYVIELSPSQKAPRSKLTVTGTLFVNTVSMALERIDWKLSPNGVRYLNNHRGYGYTIMSVAYQVSVHWTGIHEVITYAELDNKWHLKEVQKEFTATVTSRKRKMKNLNWTAKTLFVVTKVLPEAAKPFPEKDDLMKSVKPVAALMGKNFDPEFWENYNIVQPSYVDTLTKKPPQPDTPSVPAVRVSNRQNGFTRSDSLRGKLTELRTCYDVLFYHLDVTINPETKSIFGSSTIRFKTISSFIKMQIDLFANMKIEKILFHGSELSYTREFDAVFIEFPSTQPKGSTEEITVYYSGKPQEPNFSISMNGGFLWSHDKNGKPWVQVVCQGSGASLWWPNKDHLSDEPDSARITVTVPEGLTDISNGILRSKINLPGKLTRFDWYVSYPINNYNITLNIGDYAHFSDNYSGIQNNFTINYYCLPAAIETAKLLFRNVKPMLALYEKDFGPYPFPNDGFTLMESLHAMEHQSAVSVGEFENERYDSVEMQGLITLMWHEASHEWWGNSVSVKDLADFWVHEGFATYAEALNIESKYGYEASAGYMNAQAPINKEPIIGVYDVNHIFYNIGDLYNKSSLVLNTLRHVINNDSLWFQTLRGIQKQFKYQTVTSGDIENYISRETKTDYKYLFDQYLRKVSLPKFVFQIRQQGSSQILKYKWQADVKDFRMPIKVTLSKDTFGFIYPTTDWQVLTLKGLSQDDFEVAENDFLVEVVGQ